ncbi:MAG: UvrB/UvrC motif-containing protein [Clostridiales bacterium]|nr:MAG: UvrB/UvrC motif-containing protein [Clostridiales bacterium]
MTLDRDDLARKLVNIQYKRADIDFQRSTFRMRGDVVDIFPSSNSEVAIRVEFFGDEIEKLYEIDALTGKPLSRLEHAVIFPATHYVVGESRMENALTLITKDREERVKYFTDRNKLIEAQRIGERVAYDVEMMREMGYCSGIENYSRYFDGRKPGEPPYTLLDFFPKNFVCFIDESHMTIPQIRGMYNGDRSRKETLWNTVSVCPPLSTTVRSALTSLKKDLSACVRVGDSRPVRVAGSRPGGGTTHTSYGHYRPEIFIRPVEGQIDDLISEINLTVEKGGRTLVTTLTKKMAENLTSFLKEKGIKVKYMHSDIDTLERIEIINSLRKGDVDVVVGINLLREGLDLPEVMLVAILDADKEGFLRSETALIQTVGRAARNVDARVIMYADTVTGSMQRAIDETNRRRKIQSDYNAAHGIVPHTVVKEIVNTIEITKKLDKDAKRDRKDIASELERLKGLMQVAAEGLDFEAAIKLRDRISELKKELGR